MIADTLGALRPIAIRKRHEVSRLRCGRAAMWAKAELTGEGRPLGHSLSGGAVIAEMKRRSPSGGLLRDHLDCGRLAGEYVSAGAAAISVLTDRPDFGGSLDDLVAVREAVGVPVLRKDFVVDPVQIPEARIAGADWVLLIVVLLDGSLLDDCLAAARRCGAHAIVEVHSEAEVARAVDAGAECVGINNRDLRTLTTDPSTFPRLRDLVPAGTICVAESGMREPADAARFIAQGADAVLIGESLMRAASPATACAEMVRASRAAAAGDPLP
ncbi:MAG: indole-3-glycerol-phosphate synthase [Candidatus Dormibacteria bacterium]